MVHPFDEHHSGTELGRPRHSLEQRPDEHEGPAGQEAPPSGTWVLEETPASAPTREIVDGASSGKAYVRIRVPTAQPAAPVAPPSNGAFGHQDEEVVFPGRSHQMLLPGAGLGHSYVRQRLPSPHE